MFKSFSELNANIAKAVPPKRSDTVLKALNIQSDILARVRGIADEYTKSYNSVSVIKYDQDGNPIDITPSEKMTVPENRLAVVKAWLNQVRERLSVLRTEIAESSTISISLANASALVSDPYVNLAGLTYKRSQWRSLPVSVLLSFYSFINSSDKYQVVIYENSSSLSFNIHGTSSGFARSDVIYYKAGENSLNYEKLVWKSADDKSALIVDITVQTVPNDHASWLAVLQVKYWSQGMSTVYQLPTGNLTYDIISGWKQTSEIQPTAISENLETAIGDLTGFETAASIRWWFAIDRWINQYQATNRTVLPEFGIDLTIPVQTPTLDDFIIPDTDLAALEAAL